MNGSRGIVTRFADKQAAIAELKKGGGENQEKIQLLEKFADLCGREGETMRVRVLKPLEYIIYNLLTQRGRRCGRRVYALRIGNGNPNIVLVLYQPRRIVLSGESPTRRSTSALTHTDTH